MHKRIVLSGMVSLAVMLALLNYSEPTSAGPFGVLLLFVSLYVFTFSFVFLIVKIYRKILQRKIYSEKADYFYSVVIGFGPIILLLMRAFDALNIWTVLLAVIFVILGCFLVRNRFSVVK